MSKIVSSQNSKSEIISTFIVKLFFLTNLNFVRFDDKFLIKDIFKRKLFLEIDFFHIKNLYLSLLSIMYNLEKCKVRGVLNLFLLFFYTLLLILL